MEVAWWWAGDRKKEPSLHFHDCVPTYQPPIQTRRHWRKNYHPGPMAAITVPLFVSSQKERGRQKWFGQRPKQRGKQRVSPVCSLWEKGQA